MRKSDSSDSWVSQFLERLSARFSLQGKLVFLVLLVLIPVVLLNAVQIYGRFETRINQEVQSDHEFAAAISAAFLNHLESWWDDETVIGGAIIRGGDPGTTREIERVLLEQLSLHNSVQGFSWIAPDGTVTTAARPAWTAPPGAQEYLQRALTGENEVISDLIANPETGTFSIAISRGIRRSGSFFGVVVAYLDPAGLGSALPVSRSGTSNFILVDKNGLIVYRSNGLGDGLVSGWAISKDSPALEALKGKAATKRHFHATNGSDRMGAAVPIRSIGWAAVASTPTPDVLAAPTQESVRDIIVLVLVATVSLLGAVLLARWFLRPLRTLQRAAVVISQGNLSARVGLHGSDELAQTAETFDSMAAQIQALMAQREQFLQVAAHELRNPMASIKGMLSLTQRRQALGRPLGDIMPLVAVMEREIDRLSNLLNEILEAFRVQEGRLSLTCEPVHVGELVATALEPVQIMADRHNFLVHTPTPPLWVWGDYRRLEEVVRNLLGNAVKYSPDGGAIEVWVTEQQGRALIAIKDSGMGILPDQLTRIFEGFFRGSNLEGRDPGGLGLGLYICKDIVERHRGRIWAESPPNEGATFRVELPLYHPPESEEATQ